MTALYNEIEPFAADWLENLVKAGQIAPGLVERRSITDLTPSDVSGPGQRHFFAGIGVWSYALRLAGVADDADIWTGSCPCQPFSSAGKGGGVLDPRHLWPAWFDLIRECRPPVVFGEQVASRDGLAWLDLVRSDLERCGYAFGASDLCAAGVGAPHIRQRLYFMAVADGEGLKGAIGASRRWSVLRDCGELGNASRTRGWRNAGAIHRAQGEGPLERSRDRRVAHEPLDASATRELADSDEPHVVDRDEPRSGRLVQPAEDTSPGFWSACDWIPCSDGKSRPVEPGTLPLAHGATNRVGRLRAYGNAIVSWQAACFIRAAIGVIGDP